MKKYKRWFIGIGVALGVVIFFTILSFTLFAVGPVELHFKNETTKFSDVEVQNQIIKSGQIPYGMPSFAMGKSKIIENLELSNPYLKVVNIETVFPNKLVIHCAEREESFFIKSGNENYFICDNELKVLGKVTRIEQVQGDAIVLNGVQVLNNGAQIGEVLNLVEGDLVIKNIFTSFMANGKTVSDVKGMFKTISLNYETNYYTKLNEEVLTFVTHDNFEIKVCNADNLLNLKLNLMMSIIPHVSDKYATHFLTIDINPEDNSKRYTVLSEII